ncbi:LPXTG cell wall anchor domain-containing protein [Streptomyces sp. NPDC012510]|uniref:LPXTG cell wall anchor domain-containing protein n=1 Tax=Streptomyces sp. NPDC012510 TaxID=3364838 RepID=UPI0036ED8C37
MELTGSISDSSYVCWRYGVPAHAAPLTVTDATGEFTASACKPADRAQPAKDTGAKCTVLYGYDDNRFLKGAEYVAKWCLGGNVPYTPYAQVDRRPGIQTPTKVAPADPAQMRPVWAMVANHYTKRRGLSATYLTQIAARAAPEGGGGDYGPNSGGFDQLGFGTLAFTRDKATDTKATPKPAGSAPPSGAASDPRPQTATTSPASASASPTAGGDLAATGSGEIVGWTAAAGVTAVAGGLLLLRRRDRGRHGAS